MLNPLRLFAGVLELLQAFVFIRRQQRGDARPHPPVESARRGNHAANQDDYDAEEAFWRNLR